MAVRGEILLAADSFVAGFPLHEEGTGQLMSFAVWESDEAIEAGDQAVRSRPASDQRGIVPTRVERWVVDSTF
jgi:hypothetical protein